MPDELDDIRRRLDALESRMDSEAGLRAMMDLDQASLTARFDAQDNLLRALAVTQSDHTRRLTRLEDGQRRLESKVGGLETKVGSLETTVGRLETTVGRIDVGLQTVLTLLRKDP